MPKAHRVADHPQSGRSGERLGRLAAEPENRQHPASLKKLDDNPIVGRDRVQRLQTVTKSGIGRRVKTAVADAMDSDEESPNGNSRIFSSLNLLVPGCLQGLGYWVGDG